MTLFQILALTLTTGLILFELVLLAKRLTRLRFGLLRLATWVTTSIVVLWPELTMRVAGWFSIGRGADLVLYSLSILFLLTNFYFLHVLELHRVQITRLVRELAKRQPDYDGMAGEQATIQD